ncbi:hypothetical protein SOVF_156720 [Spinacia oleracea]|uniref:Uncharacterized protein n=1 Tax=Spinacia oleracea TaxID=3562 RepID=A0A9R0ITL9_SPIOL|nr:uncharacterized protein LOC110794644 [Spinacia oleracea]KNA08992.1 hypothetical protein SOVF_156720 [Spinacia oleracea]
MQRGNYNPRINPYQSHQIHQLPRQIPQNPYQTHQIHQLPPQIPQNPPTNLPINHLPPPSYPFSPEYERILRDEVIYLHSLWHRGPPSSPLNPYSRTPHFLKPSIPTIFKNTQKIPKTIQPHLISDKEWPVESIPKCPSSPSPSGSIWPRFKPDSAPVTRPATGEEKERVLGLKIQLKGLDFCSGLFNKEGDSDDGGDDDDDDGDDAEEYEFFMKVFEEGEELRGYYKKNCENGEFYCLVCGVLANKLGRKYKNCVALVQHSVTISKTKKKNAHRAYGHAICKVLGWDVHRLPALPSAVGDASGQSLDKTCVFPSESKVTADACEADGHGSLKREGICCNSEHVQLEQNNTSDSAQEVANELRAEGSGVGGESVDYELSLTGDTIK